MPWKPAIEHCEGKRAIANMQSDHAAICELRYFLAREIGERCQLIDKLTILVLDSSLNHGWSKRVVKEVLTGSLPSLITLVSKSQRLKSSITIYVIKIVPAR